VKSRSHGALLSCVLSGTWVTHYSDGINRYRCARNGP
jgi:hypothetical protein